MIDPDMKKFAELVRGVVKEELEPVTEQVANLTEKVEGVVIPALKNHTKFLKKMVILQEKNEDNIERLGSRLSETEASLGIQPPPEFQIIKKQSFKKSN